MRQPHLPVLLAAVALLPACATGEILSPSVGRSHQVSVLSRNMYVGTDVDAVIGALASPDPGDDLPALLSAIAVLQATDFPARARAMAEEIRRHRPQVVGLQEVSELVIDLTALGLPVDIRLDFLATLRAELRGLGLRYEVAARVRNIEAAPMPGIRLVDWDVLLVDPAQVRIDPATAAGHSFAANLGEVAPGVTLRRGWAQVDGRIQGIRYTFVVTHLESGNAPGLAGLRAAQATELTAVTAGAERLVILGDLNDVPGSPMWQAFAGAGLQDVWQALRPGVEGATCCHAADLSNPVPAMHSRLDYVLVRGPAPLTPLHGEVRLLGLLPSDKLAGPVHPIWPSDHAGVFSLLRAVPPDLAVR